MVAINRVTDVIASQRVERPKHRGVTFVNRGAVVGIAEYRAFEYPIGSGLTWRIAPIDYLTGIRIAELELNLLETKKAVDQLTASPERVSPADVRTMNERTARFAKQAVALAGPLMIPTGKRKRRRKLARLFGSNPLRRATVQDIASVIGFLAICLTTSQSRVRQAAAATN